MGDTSMFGDNEISRSIGQPAMVWTAAVDQKPNYYGPANRLRSRWVCGSMVDIQYATAENSWGKKKIEETTEQKYNFLPYSIGGHNKWHKFFYRSDALRVSLPTMSRHWRKPMLWEFYGNSFEVYVACCSLYQFCFKWSDASVDRI